MAGRSHQHLYGLGLAMFVVGIAHIAFGAWYDIWDTEPLYSALALPWLFMGIGAVWTGRVVRQHAERIEELERALGEREEKQEAVVDAEL